MMFGISRSVCALAGEGRFGAVLLAGLLTITSLGGCSQEETREGEIAVKINDAGVYVSDFDYALERRGDIPEFLRSDVQVEVLDALIDQEVAIQQLHKLKQDRQAYLLQFLDATRRDLLVKAYFEHLTKSVPKPTPAEIQEYYDKNPALFSERRIYELREMMVRVDPERLQEVQDELARSKNLADFGEWLKQKEIAFNVSQSTQAAERLPLRLLSELKQFPAGHLLTIPGPDGLRAILVVNTRSDPVSVEQAEPVIQGFLVNERKRQIIEKATREERAAARIEYQGTYAKR